jgi:hypothetical protein
MSCILHVKTFVLPQNIGDPETIQNRVLQLELACKDRVPHKEEGLPTRHAEVPISERDLFLAVSRQLYINSFRYWIGWARIACYNLFWNSPPSIEKHRQTIWLFPEPQLREILEFPLGDDFFAKQRFCGPQTSNLSRLTALPPWVPKTDSILHKLKASHLFVVDYSILKDCKTKPHGYMPWTMGIFSCKEGTEFKTECLFVDGKVLYPSNPGSWTYAKACFQVNDAIYYFVVNRLCGAFLFTEPIVLYFFRNIPTQHPLHPLFKPLFTGHANACHWIRKFLLKEDGLINALLPLSTEGIRDLVELAYHHWTFEGTNFVGKLNQRQLLACQGYAYAEDGRELFSVVQAFVFAYINKIYSTDAEVANDKELQQWCQDTTSNTEGAVKGFPKRVGDKAALAQLVAHLFYLFLFDRYVLHYSSYDHMGFMPSFPLSVRKYPEHSTPLTAEEVLHMLNSERNTLAQLHALYVFCHELLPKPEWIAQELPHELAEFMGGAEKMFQTKKVLLRNHANARPTPYKHFVLQTGFLKVAEDK